MDKKSITFETKCWEADWRILLSTDYLKRQIDNCNYDFAEKVLFINNVDNVEAVKAAAEIAVSNRVIDRFYVVEDYAEEALLYFNIAPDSFMGGYYYSIAELVSIYLCKTDYLFHFSSDTRLARRDKSDFIKESINLLESCADIAVVNPVWNYQFTEAYREAFEERGNFLISYGFSDQCYLIRTKEFQKQIYNEHNPLSERYPKYGGELFEKRVDAYMRNQNRLRATYKKLSYFSDNLNADLKRIKILKQRIKYRLRDVILKLRIRNEGVRNCDGTRR